MTEEKKELVTKIEETERLTLELAKQRRIAAIVANENAELAHKNLILQLYMKYNLSANDSIKEDTGEIVRGDTQIEKISEK